MLSSLNSKMISSAPYPQAIAQAATTVRVRNALCAAPLAGAPQPADRARFVSESIPGALPWLSISEPRLDGHFPQRTMGASAARDSRVNVPVPVTLPEAEITQSGDTPVVRVG